SELFRESAGLDHRGYLSSIRGQIQIFPPTICDRTSPPLSKPNQARLPFLRSRFQRWSPDAPALPRVAPTFSDADRLRSLPIRALRPCARETFASTKSCRMPSGSL